MWVTITHRDGARLVGELGNWPPFVHMNPGEKVKFHIDDIIDCPLDGEDAAEQVASRTERPTRKPRGPFLR